MHPGSSSGDCLPGPWFHTDDTEMALSIVDTLKLYGHIHQDELARRFAWRFEREPDRGYGSMTRKQLGEINRGGDWRQGAATAFGGQGSMGNGGAMRVAPLGAYFADDLSRVVEQARASSLVTHTHPEGVTGTIAIAIAAAKAWQLREADSSARAARLFDAVLKHTPRAKSGADFLSRPRSGHGTGGSRDQSAGQWLAGHGARHRAVRGLVCGQPSRQLRRSHHNDNFRRWRLRHKCGDSWRHCCAFRWM